MILPSLIPYFCYYHIPGWMDGCVKFNCSGSEIYIHVLFIPLFLYFITDGDTTSPLN